MSDSYEEHLDDIDWLIADARASIDAPTLATQPPVSAATGMSRRERREAAEKAEAARQRARHTAHQRREAQPSRPARKPASVPFPEDFDIYDYEENPHNSSTLEFDSPFVDEDVPVRARQRKSEAKPRPQPRQTQRGREQARNKPRRAPATVSPKKLNGKNGNKKVLILLYAIMVICIIGLGIVIPKIVTTVREYRAAKMEYDKVSESALFVKEEPTRDEVKEIIFSYVDRPMEDQEVEEAIDDYLASWVPVEVDWDYLQSTNADVIGWIYCEDTQINYPVTQTNNNSYYLSRTINRNYSGSGTIFANYQSSLGNRLSNFILYGHHMKNDSMFGILDHYKKESFYNDHPVMYFLTPQSTYKISIISGHIVESSSKNFPVMFSSDSDYQNYLDKILNACSWGRRDLATTDYQLMTLVTCDYTYGYADPRYIVHGMMEPIGGVAYEAMKEAESGQPEMVPIEGA